MKKLILGLLISIPFIYASDIVQMPNKKVLQARLDAIGMTYFAEKTKIIAQLADQEKAPLGVAMAVELSMHDYFEYIKKGMPAQMVRMQQVQMAIHKPLIFEALLKDEPAALEELKGLGIYEPAE